MKSQKGITLMSIAIYIAVILIVIGILATITSNIQQNVKDKNTDGEKMAEVNKFNMYFIQEVKREKNEVSEWADNRITFSSGRTFLFDSQSNSIKLIENENTIEIAKNIESCSFIKELENGKVIISVTIKPQNVSIITNEYVLNTEQLNTTYENEEEYVTKKTNQTQNVTPE